MAVLKIYTDDSPVLRKKSKPVDSLTKEIKKLFKDMQQTMRAKKGMGLAAPQVGILQRIIVYEYRPKKDYAIQDEIIPFGVIVNPHIYWISTKKCKMGEGCLSLPGINDIVSRPAEIMIRGLDENGKKIDFKAKGLLARIIQHEVDHLNGILFIDYLKDKTQKK